MEVWKIVFHLILEIFHCIPFWDLPYSIPKFPFHSIFYSIPYHALVVNFILLLLLQHFTLKVVARLKIRKRLILKKLLPLPAPFQHFRFRVRFRFQPLSSKCFRFHKKLTASTASASTSPLFVDKNYRNLNFDELTQTINCSSVRRILKRGAGTFKKLRKTTVGMNIVSLEFNPIFHPK